MKYAVLGAGAMGSLIGAHLKKAGCDVVLVDPYQEHMDEIKNNGLEMTINGKKEIVKISTFTSPQEVGQVGVVIVLVKGPYTENAIEGARSLFGQDTFVLTLQNGLGNSDILLRLFPEERVLSGVMKITSALRGPGKIESNMLQNMAAVYVGSATGIEKANMAAKQIAKDLTTGGLKTEYQDDVQHSIWAKAVNNIAVNSACAIARVNIKNYCTHPQGREMLEKTIQEVVAVANAKGIGLRFNEVISSIEENTIPKFGEHFPSTAQDVRAKRKTEIMFLNGAISKYGRRLNIPTPMNDCITDFIRVIEDHYEDQF